MQPASTELWRAGGGRGEPRPDKIGIPVLVVQGDQDRILPYEATGKRLPALLKNARSIVIAGGPHAIIWTHADEVNQALLDFIDRPG